MNWGSGSCTVGPQVLSPWLIWWDTAETWWVRLRERRTERSWSFGGWGGAWDPFGWSTTTSSNLNFVLKCDDVSDYFILWFLQKITIFCSCSFIKNWGALWLRRRRKIKEIYYYGVAKIEAYPKINVCL